MATVAHPEHVDRMVNNSSGPMLSIQFAERCAWRAVYVRIHGRQVFHVGLDPDCYRGPCLFGGFNDDGWYDNFRIALPFLRYRHKMGRLRLAAYLLQQRALHAIDGRS